MDMVVLMELQIIGSYGNPHSAYPTLLSLVGSGRLKPKELVSREVGLEDVDSVLHDMDDFKTAGYVVITRF
jgi:propanol-preferring alcohol dehydrogenase